MMWKLLGSYLLIASLISTCYSTTTYPPALYTTNGHYYQIVVPTSPQNFADASTYAGSQSILNAQGYLVTIADANEQAFVQNLLTSGTVTSGASWTGAKKSGTNWYWYALSRISASFYSSSYRTCLTASYCNWAVNEPSTTTGTYNLQIPFTTASDPTAGQWFAHAATDLSSAYIIEYDQPTCPSGQTLNPVARTCNLRSVGMEHL